MRPAGIVQRSSFTCKKPLLPSYRRRCRPPPRCHHLLARGLDELTLGQARRPQDAVLPTMRVPQQHHYQHRASHNNSVNPTSTGETVLMMDPLLSKYLVEEAGLEDNPSLHRGMLKALESVYGKGCVRVHHLQAFGASGLRDLAASVAEQQTQQQQRQQQMAANVTAAGAAQQPQRRPSRMVHFTIPHHHTEFDLKWRLGESLLDVAKGPAGVELLGEYLEATCGGNMSCCTCHVYLDMDTYQALPPPTDAELDMLDLAYDPQDTSRLACQVRLQANLIQSTTSSQSSNDKADHTITVTIPAGVTNVWS